MAQAKRIYILMIKVNKLFSFSRRSVFFKKKIEKAFSVFLLSYKNTHDSLGELETTVETLTCKLMFPHHFSFSQASTRVSINW